MPHRVVLSIKRINTYKVFRTVPDAHKVLNKFGLLLFFDIILSLNVKTGHCVPLREKLPGIREHPYSVTHVTPHCRDALKKRFLGYWVCASCIFGVTGIGQEHYKNDEIITSTLSHT